MHRSKIGTSGKWKEGWCRFESPQQWLRKVHLLGDTLSQSVTHSAHLRTSSAVKVILQTQQRLKGRGEGRGGIGRRALERKRGESEGASRQSYKLIALRSDCSFLCINPCSLASPLARSLFPRHCCLSESSCPHSPFFFSPSCNVVDPKLGTDFGGHKRSNLPLLGTIQNS